MASNPENSGTSNPPIAGALTFPARSDQNLHSLPVQPRQPRNLQGLLRFAMEATKAEDAPGNSNLGPMDEERRKFLEEALKSLTIDVAEVIQKAIKVLTDQEKMKSIKHGDPLPEDVASSFSNLMEFVDNIDIANDFYKMGGFAIFPICYSSENDEVRANASWVLAELCQNNPYCQSKALECGLLNVLLNLVQTEQGTALAKCLYAISCTCREYLPACHELVQQGGCDTLAQLLTAPDLQARTKVAFLVRYLCLHHPEAKEKFIKMNLIKTITDLIKQGRNDTTEHLLSILVSLTEGYEPRTMLQCSDPNLGLKQVLEELAQFEDEREYSLMMLKMLEKCPNIETVNTEADR